MTTFGSEQMFDLDEETDEVRSTVYADLEPMRTRCGLHTTCSKGSVHVLSDQSHLPHAVVHTLDMAKTKGPMHKSIDGSSTRLLMVLVVNLCDGDADVVVTANKEVPTNKGDAWFGTRYWGSLSDAGFDPNEACYAAVLKGRTVDKATWVIIDPEDPRYVQSHKVDYEAMHAAASLEQDLAVRVAKRKEIEAAMAHGIELADKSVFYITVTGVMRLLDFAVLTRTIFRNEMPNLKLQRFISVSASHSEKIYKRIKATLDCSHMRLRFGRHGVSVRKLQDRQSLRSPCFCFPHERHFLKLAFGCLTRRYVIAATPTAATSCESACIRRCLRP